MLEKLKDIIYDKNDIIVALAIVLVAGVIISNQVDSIMSYPEQLAEELQQEQEEQLGSEDESGAKPGGDTEGEDPAIGSNGEGDVPGGESSGGEGSGQGETVTPPDTPDEPDTPSTPVTPPASSEFKTQVDRTVEIPSGSFSNKIAQILREAGVVPSEKEFLQAVNDAGLDTKLKAGTFKIPAGSTLDDVVHIVTK